MLLDLNSAVASRVSPLFVALTKISPITPLESALTKNTRGWVSLDVQDVSTFRLLDARLFSHTYKSLFQQLLSFHIDPKRRGCTPKNESQAKFKFLFPGMVILATRLSPLGDCFSGATMVSMKTKAICHLALALAATCLLPFSGSAQTIDEIVAKVFTARGGLDKIRAVKSQRVSGKISFGDVSGPFVVELKRPLKMHMQLTVQNLTMVRVYDGKSGWANNPFAGKMNPDAMSEEELKNITEESDFDGPLVDYKQKGNQVELVGKDKVKDKDAWRLKLTTKNGEVRHYLFDAGSFLLLKWEGQRKYEGKEFPVESYFSDYRDVGGLKYAFEIDSGASATDITQKISIEKIDLNPEINDAEFAKPTPPPAPEAPGSAPTSPAPESSPESKPPQAKPPKPPAHSESPEATTASFSPCNSTCCHPDPRGALLRSSGRKDLLFGVQVLSERSSL